MRHFFILNGEKSRDFGLYISGSGTYNSPERDVEVVSVPGRNGDLILDNGRFKNVMLSYPAFLRSEFLERSAAIREWLLSYSGYRRLEDTYHQDEFRMARYTGNIEFDMRVLNKSGECTLNFDCKPQRFLKSGEQMITITQPDVIRNPTRFEARPLLRVYADGSGIIFVGNNQIEIRDIGGFVDIDCELQNAYRGTENMNSRIYLKSGDFPVLKEKATELYFDGDITKIEIKPRWWSV